MKVLRDMLPTVAISVHREHDRDAVWDGEGPDPVEIGYEPYVVVVRAIAIMNGEIIEGSAYLGSSYYKADEPLGMVHGYLPQLIEEALEELHKIHPAGWLEVVQPFLRGVSIGVQVEQEEEA